MARLGKLRSITREATACWLLIDSWIAVKAENTQTQYKRVLVSWCRFIGAETYTEEGAEILLTADDRDAYEYVLNLQARPAQPGRSEAICKTVSKATVSRTVIILTAVYNELIRSRYLEQNPFGPGFHKFRRSEVGTRRPSQLIPFEAVQKILERPDVSPEGCRDAAFFALLFGGGLRISEAVNLQLSDLSFLDGAAVLVLRDTKAGKTVSQVVSYGASIIEKYYKIRVADGPKLVTFLVSYAYGKPKGTWSISTAHRTFKRYCAACGLPQFSPHCARATAITKLLDDGVPHRDVATFSRHSSIQMVERYDKRRLKISDAIALKLKF